MGIGLRQLAVFQHSHRPPADVIIELGQGLGHQHRHLSGVVLAAGSQQRRGCGHQEERPFEGAGRLVLQQIGMECAIGRQQFAKQDLKQAFRLPGIAKRRFAGLQHPQPLPQQARYSLSSVGSLGLSRASFQRSEQIAHRPPRGRIERA